MTKKGLRNLIIATVIIVVFIYWFTKRTAKTGLACANLWQDMDNGITKKGRFHDQLTLIDNNNDAVTIVEDRTQESGESYDYEACKYATDLITLTPEQEDLLTTTQQPQSNARITIASTIIAENRILTSQDSFAVKECICEKMKIA